MALCGTHTKPYLTHSQSLSLCMYVPMPLKAEMNDVEVANTRASHMIKSVMWGRYVPPSCQAVTYTTRLIHVISKASSSSPREEAAKLICEAVRMSIDTEPHNTAFATHLYTHLEVTLLPWICSIPKTSTGLEVCNPTAVCGLLSNTLLPACLTFIHAELLRCHFLDICFIGYVIIFIFLLS